MGWEARDVGIRVALHLDAHGGEAEQRHEVLADEIAAELRAATLAVLRNPKYREILLFDPEWYVDNDM